VPLTPQTTAILRDYLSLHPRRAEPDAPLFPAVRLATPNQTGKRADDSGLTKTAKERAERQQSALAALAVDEAEARLILDWSEPLRHSTLLRRPHFH
jgi:hypothetical protein